MGIVHFYKGFFVVVFVALNNKNDHIYIGGVIERENKHQTIVYAIHKTFSIEYRIVCSVHW